MTIKDVAGPAGAGIGGVWSAAPTPFADDWKVDTGSVKRMVEHHLRLGVRGLFLGGTCGEGPLLPDRERHRLVQTVVEQAQGRLVIAVQVTDNSALRILDNIEGARDDGADIAIIAPPYFMSNVNPQTLLDLYLQAIRESPLPVGIYDRGAYSSILIPESVLAAAYAEKNVILVKDSSGQLNRRDVALAARAKRPELRLLDGDEFRCAEYLQAGYDGLLLGGGVFNGYLAGKIIAAVAAGDVAQAEQLQDRMNRVMWDVYGGKTIACWLSGLKKLLVEMGIFQTWKNIPGYPLTDECIRAIERVLVEDREVLFP
ncbi:MAG: dihydrodipicolinate synthase family protein [Chloroflexi bacterium]|nr:dihydrodipicolinate synthase family protein [Chloroflexota bacterium]